MARGKGRPKLNKRDQKIYDQTIESLRRAKVIPPDSRKGKKLRKEAVERSVAREQARGLRFGFSISPD